MFWKKVVLRNYFLASIALNMLSAIGTIAIKSFMPPLIPIFYGRPTGADQLASFWFIFLIPGVAISITITNLFISISLKDDLIKKIIAISSFIISGMATFTIIKIILLIGFF